jgi:hypothetical protein
VLQVRRVREVDDDDVRRLGRRDESAKRGDVIAYVLGGVRVERTLLEVVEERELVDGRRGRRQREEEACVSPHRHRTRALLCRDRRLPLPKAGRALDRCARKARGSARRVL